MRMKSHRYYCISGIQLEISEITYEPSEDSFLLMDVLRKLNSIINPKLILEIGTGSGIIAITAAQLYPTARIIATDISLACSVAQKNAMKNDCTIECLRGDLFTPFRGKSHQFDLIIFNPPYVVSESLRLLKNRIDVQDRNWAGGKKGREMILRFLREVKNHLHSQGLVTLIVSSQNDLTFMKQEVERCGFSIILEMTRKIPKERLFGWVLKKTHQVLL